MNRKGFLKSLGISVLAPTVLIPKESNGSVTFTNEIPINKFNPKRYPIYPDRTQYSLQNHNHIAHNIFSYVKIEREGVEYLIPVKETTIDDFEMTSKRFEYAVKEVQEKYIVQDLMVEKEWILKYDKDIHKD